MSIFGSIVSAIFGKAAHADTLPPGATPASAGGPATPGSIAAQVPAGPVDITAILDKLTDESDETDIDWRKSIVDLMKLLKLDSSLGARRTLATELQYPGDTKDSGAMNVWLHKQVMTMLAANGGKVPAELKH